MALLRVKTAIMKSTDDNKAVAVVLLDLSAAFDTVEHRILLIGYVTHNGIIGRALEWIDSYFSDPSFRVSIGNATSASQTLCYGIPQGSVVGPLFFVWYTCCIGTIIRKYSDIKYRVSQKKPTPQSALFFMKLQTSYQSKCYILEKYTL